MDLPSDRSIYLAIYAARFCVGDGEDMSSKARSSCIALLALMALGRPYLGDTDEGTSRAVRRTLIHRVAAIFNDVITTGKGKMFIYEGDEVERANVYIHHIKHFTPEMMTWAAPKLNETIAP